jgi:hypothetical protein
VAKKWVSPFQNDTGHDPMMITADVAPSRGAVQRLSPRQQKKSPGGDSSLSLTSPGGKAWGFTMAKLVSGLGDVTCFEDRRGRDPKSLVSIKN